MPCPSLKVLKTDGCLSVNARLSLHTSDGHVIGRGTDCHTVLKWDGASRIHARIRYVKGDDGWVIETGANVRNGLFVNNKKVSRHLFPIHKHRLHNT